MYSIIDLHDRILFYLLIILFVVVWFLVSVTLNPLSYRILSTTAIDLLGSIRLVSRNSITLLYS